jgi:hypothetical protein
MTHLSEHDLWTTGSIRVATMAPGPGDLFVVTTLGGKRVFVEPTDQYERAVRVAESIARRVVHDRPVIIRVLPMTLAELLAHMGTTREQLAQGASPEDDAADRKLIIDTCMAVLRECNDAAVRTDAYNLLVSMGCSSNETFRSGSGRRNPGHPATPF